LGSILSLITDNWQFIIYLTAITVNTGTIGQASWKQPNTTCQQLIKCTKQYTRQCIIQTLFDQYHLAIAYQPWMTAPSKWI
jgi:hypothetical protein